MAKNKIARLSVNAKVRVVCGPRTEPEWRARVLSRVAQRAGGARSPWRVATRLGLRVRVLDVPGLEFGTGAGRLLIGDDADSGVLELRLAHALALRFLERSSREWNDRDVEALAFGLLGYRVEQHASPDELLGDPARLVDIGAELDRLICHAANEH